MIESYKFRDTAENPLDLDRIVREAPNGARAILVERQRRDYKTRQLLISINTLIGLNRIGVAPKLGAKALAAEGWFLCRSDSFGVIRFKHRDGTDARCCVVNQPGHVALMLKAIDSGEML
jgi:hypothetical protein